MHTKIKQTLFIFAPIVSLLLFFQNCGNVKLNANKVDDSSAGTIEGSFCSSLRTSDPSTVLSFYVANFTARVNRANGLLEADSDMDGIPDNIEDGTAYTNLGYSSTNRRSFGGILDRMCADQGSISCDGSGDLGVVTPGFVNSDLSIFNFGAGSVPGVNSDNDLIPDFIEYLFSESFK